MPCPAKPETGWDGREASYHFTPGDRTVESGNPWSPAHDSVEPDSAFQDESRKAHGQVDAAPIKGVEENQAWSCAEGLSKRFHLVETAFRAMPRSWHRIFQNLLWLEASRGTHEEREATHSSHRERLRGFRLWSRSRWATCASPPGTHRGRSAACHPSPSAMGC